MIMNNIFVSLSDILVNIILMKLVESLFVQIIQNLGKWHLSYLFF